MHSQESAFPTEALAWLTEEGQVFDVVLLDMQMPEMDGATLGGEIQRRLAAAAPPLVMLTSLGLKEVDHAGVDLAAYLTKPIKPAVLYQTLLAVFGGHEASARPSRDRQTPPAAPDAPAARPLRLLLAEDNLVNQKVAHHLLARLGYRIDVAGNGAEALAALARQPYDAILMDVQMPELDGLAATRQIRAGTWQDSGRTYQPYIIAMTASALQGDREACLAAGMDDYVSKPINLPDLKAALARVPAGNGAPGETAAAPAPPPPPAARPAAAGRDPIDPDALARFTAEMGSEDPAIVAELLAAYLSEGHSLTAELQASRAPETIRRLAHSLKSSSLLVGALTLGGLCADLERRAGLPGFQPDPEAAAAITAEFASVAEELSKKEAD
jgi:CheY-like chemotaxis protein/HPt (histidine-containing phosphotransfer) domain-containing protein